MGNLDLERETWSNRFDFLLSCIGYAVGLGNIWRFPYLCYRNGGGKCFNFLLSCIGYAVGLGNIWRFPYLCYRNGGGAFLVPYLIMLVIAGLPIFFFELALGQFASEGPITVWKVNPMFYGIGWGMVLISAMVCMYYNVIIMYAVYYMFVSFVSLDGEVPWSDCKNSWNTRNCRDEPYPSFNTMTNETAKIDEKYNLNENEQSMRLDGEVPWADYKNSWNTRNCRDEPYPSFNTMTNKTAKINKKYKMMDEDCVTKNLLKNSVGGSPALTIYTAGYELLNNFTDCSLKLVSPSEEYWSRYVLRLDEADGLDDVGGISLKNAVCLLFTWVLIFFCLMKGIKSSGKVVYFTATFPYLILIVLLVRGVTLPGHMDGIEFYIIPKWEQLKDPKVWSDAATQIFYSLGPAFGGLLCMSSFNPFKNNCFKDSIIVALINCSTSIFGGFAIFSLLGYMAHQTNQAVEDVADSGPGLAFVAYPEGLAQLPVSSLWAFLFFFMILTLGLDSQFVMMETVISGLTDVWPNVLRKRKTLFTFIVCVVGFLFGLPMTTKGGIYILTLFDWYSASYGLMLVALAEFIAVAWIYGIRNFIKDIEMMIGEYPMFMWSYYIATWCFITPVAIVFIIIMTGINYTAAYYGDYTFPTWAEGIGWVMVCMPVILILIGIIYQCVRCKGNFREAVRPDPTWGPRLAANRIGKYNDNLGFVPDDDIQNEKKIYAVDSNVKDVENGPPAYPHFDRL